MAETILLIGHGTRDGEGVAEFLRFAAAVRAVYGGYTVAPCFLEFARPSILEAVDQAAATGTEGIVLMPLFLFAARHMKEDIAGAMAAARARHPHLPFRAAQHLGVDARLLALLDERLAEVGSPAGARRRDATAVLLVGRGSHRPEGNAGVYEVADRLRAARGDWVEVCFAGLAQPRVAEGIRQCVERGARRVIVLPYLLFAGVLTQRIRAAAAAAQVQFPDVEIIAAGHLGGHPHVLAVVGDRLAEALAGKWEAAYA